jgi:hypothetical protein
MPLVSPIKIRYKGYNKGDKMKKQNIIKNKKMSPEVYNLKQIVLGIVYKAKQLTSMPWIQVRIGDATPGNEPTLACI